MKKNKVLNTKPPLPAPPPTFPQTHTVVYATDRFKAVTLM